MTKILLVSDTHGNLDLLESLIAKTEADAVIHAGDFGFYDQKSLKRLQTGELRLLVQHSSYKKLYPEIKERARGELIEIIQKYQLLGNFCEYSEGKKQFPVPIYAVWGNHEDIEVVKQLREYTSIPNLFLLSEQHCYKIGNTMLYGIGGNWIPGKKLYDPLLAGSGGKIWFTLSQFGKLYEKIKNHQALDLCVACESWKRTASLKAYNSFWPAALDQWAYVSVDIGL